jgi:hypothetical protein
MWPQAEHGGRAQVQVRVTGDDVEAQFLHESPIAVA